MDRSLPFDGFPGRPDGSPNGSASESPADVRALIALSLVPGVGSRRLRGLLSRFRRPSAVLEAPRSVLMGVPGIGPQTADAIRRFERHEDVDRQLRRARALDATPVPAGDPRYPALLAEIYDPPAFLWVRGRLSDRPGVAIVGTRRCTDYGRAQARRLGADLARRGYVVVSGLAYGIDAAAHRGALDAGGQTVAVLGSGVGCVYPKEHASLARRIAEQGAVVSEYAVDAAPEPSQFPERNRIVSGLSLGTIVVESHDEGGALITARMAVEQNREIFAVPGNAGKPSSLGTNRLIQRGHAKLVLEADDVVSEFAPAMRPSADESGPSAVPEEAPADAPSLSETEQSIYDALDADPIHIDALCDRVGVGPSAALASLLRLEFDGLVRQLPGRQFHRSSGA